MEGVRHELLDPVNAIIGFSRMLLEDESLHGEQMEGVRAISEAGRGLLSLLEQLRAAVVRESLDPQELRRIRHDFINELNIVEGYVELILDEPGPESSTLAGDLAKVQRAADQARNSVEEVAQWIASHGGAKTVNPAIRPGAENYQRAVSSLSDSESTSAVSIPGARLLVVDDDPSNRDLLERRLQALEYRVELAGDGVEALERLRQDDFDLVLLDIIMPQMNGYEVLAAMRGDERLRHVPVIVVTAFDDTDSVVRCIELGADEYLPKTFNPVLLRARISACLEKKRYRDRERQVLAELAQARNRAESLLLNILPRPIAERLKTGESQIATKYQDATVLFADLVDFTAFCASVEAEKVVERLNAVFLAFDEIVEARGLEKIKTVGDAYMLAGGIPVPSRDHADAVADAALSMQAAVAEMAASGQFPNRVRIGIHSGPVVAGVIGRSKFSYDLWGDTVNVASRMETLGKAGEIHLSDETRTRLGERYECESRGIIEVKGKGPLQTFFLRGRRDLHAKS